MNRSHLKSGVMIADSGAVLTRPRMPWEEVHALGEGIGWCIRRRELNGPSFQYASLGPVRIEGIDFAAGYFMTDDVVTEVALVLDADGANAVHATGDAQNEALFYRAWLSRAGVEAPATYPWGRIFAGRDERAGFSCIKLKYLEPPGVG
jgi:hypothetical protein